MTYFLRSSCKYVVCILQMKKEFSCCGVAEKYGYMIQIVQKLHQQFDNFRLLFVRLWVSVAKSWTSVQGPIVWCLMNISDWKQTLMGVIVVMWQMGPSRFGWSNLFDHHSQNPDGHCLIWRRVPLCQDGQLQCENGECIAKNLFWDT